MSDNHETTQDKQGQAFDMSSCTEMMSKMMSQEGQECDCAGMMSQFMEQVEIPEEWLEMMSQMMASCGGAPEETTSES
ncbi:MAG: hypothetical protein GTO18_06875 [Anaerolineales bacterium]|nr:hypothetical protein [Anaerolineales bacterium]